MLGNLLSFVVKRWSVLLMTVFALAALAASVTANSYRNEVLRLTVQRQADAEKAEQSYVTVFNLLEKERKDAKEKFAELERINDSLLAQRDGLHRDLAALQSDLASAAADECCRRSKAFVGFTDRGIELAARCAAELARKQQALETCVRAYEDVRIVNDSAK